MLRTKRLRHGERADLVEHLGELRSRLVVSILALGVGFGVAYAFHGRLLDWLNAPLPPEHRRPITLGIAEPFTTSLKVSLFAGFALALPVIVWQVWGFLAPAIQQGTRRGLVALAGAAAALFAGGLAFGYVIALPAAVHFLTNYDAGSYNIQVRASTYYSFALTVLLAVGLVFELPIFVLGLVRLGITSASRLRRNRRIGYVAVAALAVALPGVDPVTTAFEMVPLMVLFEASIWLSVIFERRWQAAPATPALEL